jgi:hypothetical protein
MADTLTDPALTAADQYLNDNSVAHTATAVYQNNPGMDHQTAVALAQASPNAQQAQQQAQTVSQQVRQTGLGALEHTFYDPVLQAQPSAILAAAQYLHNVLGPPPVSGGSITQIQQALVSDGFLKTVSGQWDTASQDAYAQAINTFKQQQLGGGHKPLSSMFSTALHSLFHTATHPWDAIVGFGQDVRALTGDLAGGAAGLGAAVFNPLGNTTKVSGTVSANVQRALGRSNYSNQQGIHDDNWRHAVGDLFTAAGLFTAGGLNIAKGLGKEAIKAGVEDVAKQSADLAAHDAALTRMTHIGVALNAASKMGFVGRTIADIGDTLAAGTLPADSALVQKQLGIVSKSLLSPARVGGKLMGSNWAANVPALARLAPVVTRIGEGANEGGWAYQMRNFYGMSPYRLAAVRAAGQITSRAQVAALGLHGLAAVEGAAGATDTASAIQNAQIAPLDHWVDNTTWNVIPGVTLTPADLLLGPLHGDLTGVNRASRVIGDTVNAWQNQVADWAGRTGVIGAFEHTTGLSYNKLLDIAGGDTASLHLWMRTHQTAAAEDQFVTHELGHPPYATGDPAEEQAITDLRTTWQGLSDEQKRQQQASFLNADTHHQFLRNHLNGSFLADAGSKAARKAATETSLRDYLKALPLGQDLIHSGAAQFVMGPTGRALAKEDAILAAITGTEIPGGALSSQHLSALYKPKFTRGTGQEINDPWLDQPKGELPAAAEPPRADTRPPWTPSKAMQDATAAYHARLDAGEITDPLLEEHVPADHSQLDPQAAGSVGLMAKDGMTANRVIEQEAPAFQREINRISRMDESPAQTEATKTLADKMIGFLHTHFNWDASRLQMLGKDPAKILEVIKEQAGKLASDVFPTMDQPEWVARKIEALNAAGYKLVVGSHIGHHLDGTLPDLGPVDGKLTLMRKAIGKMGLDPQRVQDIDVGRAQNLNIQNRVHNLLVNNPNMLTTTHADYRTVMAVLHHGVDQELPAYARGIFNAFSRFGMNKSNIEMIAARDYAGQADATLRARHDMEHAMAAQAGLRDIPLKKARAALETTHDVTLPGGGTFTWNAVDKTASKQIMAAVDQGYRLPGYMMGWQAVENWARAGFGIGDKLMARSVDNPLYQVVANWPNKIINARNQLRFTISPIFGGRRLIKQDYKMKLEGVDPVWNPLAKMQADGILDEAIAHWNKLSGSGLTDQMETDRYLTSRDIFGLYDPQWHAAYFAHELAKQGKSPAEIKDAYNRVFKYGADGGRTGLERTTNTIFFPFSFEKTLLRNTGGYLLDHPGQALALDLAVEEWRKLDNNGQIGRFVDAHLPLLREMNMFNAFSHGISPGMFGGINGPILGSLLAGGSTAAADATSGKSELLLNLLLPQSWGIKFTKKDLAKYIPVWTQLSKIMDATYQQGKIATGAAHDSLAKVAGYDWRPMTALSDFAQRQYAVRDKHTLATQLQDVISFNNAQGSDADKYLWPDSFPPGVAGNPVNKTTIGLYMQYLYPAYDPAKAQADAKKYAQQADSFVASFKTKDPAKFQQMTAFKKLADTVVLHLARDEYDTAAATQVQNNFQSVMQDVATRDASWRKLYETFYAHSLGPIRSYNGRGA